MVEKLKSNRVETNKTVLISTIKGIGNGWSSLSRKIRECPFTHPEKIGVFWATSSRK
jgi:hypothetical protein